jgi:DNA-binding transcriptional regulator LsrR (DeoR family)
VEPHNPIAVKRSGAAKPSQSRTPRSVSRKRSPALGPGFFLAPRRGSAPPYSTNVPISMAATVANTIQGQTYLMPAPLLVRVHHVSRHVERTEPSGNRPGALR